MSLALIAMASVKIFQNCKSFTSKFTVNILKKARCFEITDGTVRTLVWLVNKETNKCLSMLTAAENGGLCGRITKNHNWDGSWWCSSKSQKHQSVPVLSRTCQARCLSVVCTTAATVSTFTKIATDFTTAF